MSYSIYVSSSESQNSGANNSTVYANVTLVATNQGYAGYSPTGTVTIGGSVFGYSGPGSLNTDGVGTETWTSPTFSVTYTHDVNGYRVAVGTSGTFSGGGGYAPGDLSAGGTTFGAIDYVRLPSAPASVTTSAVGAAVTVTAGAASTPGPTITNYWVSYASSTDGGVTWSAWSAETAMTNRVYTYTLTPGLTYKFQVRAQNGDGYGPYTTSATSFLTAGGKRYTGTNWALNAAAAKRFDGTAFVALTILKRYDGSTWVNLS